jgi:hypothetical protein
MRVRAATLWRTGNEKARAAIAVRAFRIEARASARDVFASVDAASAAAAGTAAAGGR